MQHACRDTRCSTSDTMHVEDVDLGSQSAVMALSLEKKQSRVERRGKHRAKNNQEMIGGCQTSKSSTDDPITLRRLLNSLLLF